MANARMSRRGSEVYETWKISHLESLDEGLRLVIPNEGVSIVETGEDPRLSGVKVDALDAVGASGEHNLFVMTC